MSRQATTPITIHDDGKWIRTAIVCADEVGSLALVNEKGERLALLNISYLPNSEGQEVLIVDVIDVDERFTNRRMLGFSNTERKVEKVPGKLASVDFRRAKE